MHYPSIEEYKEAVIIPESFASLSYLQPVKDPQGFPIFIAGGPAVVFKMQDSRNRDKYFALKCFTQEQPQRKRHFEAIHQYLKKIASPYFVDYQYLENELWVNESEYPALLMEWIEGTTMSGKIEELCSTNDKHGLAQLVYNFNNLAIWMLQQDCAHGDIKPENILVTPSGDLKLVDYDGMFVPALEGETAPELGTAEYCHPRRMEEDFNAHLDDFPLLLLSLSLLSLQKKPELYETDHQGDSLLFRADDYKALHKSRYYPFFTQEVAEDKNISSLFGLLQYAVSIPVLELIGLQNLLHEINGRVNNFKYFNILAGENVTVKLDMQKLTNVIPVKKESFSERLARMRNEIKGVKQKRPSNDNFDALNTTVNQEEPTWTDEYGVIYSEDRKKLIKGNEHLTKYKVWKQTLIICDEAFLNCENLYEIQVSECLESIGEYAFKNCKRLYEIHLPNRLLKIKKGAFYSCINLAGILLPNKLTSIEDETFYSCSKMITIDFPENVSSIGNEAFYDCENLIDFIFPKSVKYIGEWAFSGCKKLEEIRLTDNLKTLKRGAFARCMKLSDINLPDSLETLERGLFAGCEKLLIDHLPIITKDIEDVAFMGCKELREIHLPVNLYHIGIRAFSDCANLKTIFFPKLLHSIEREAFQNCLNLSSVCLYENLNSIGSKAFHGCKKLHIVQLSQNVQNIDEEAFNNCPDIGKILIPKGSRSHFERFQALENFKDKFVEV